MVKRGPDGKFVSGGEQVYRATAYVTPDSADDTNGVLEEPAYAWQAPDTDRTVVGTALVTPSRPGEATGGEKRNLAEISFDANAQLIHDDEENRADDTRSSVLHMAGALGHSDSANDLAFGPTYAPQNAEWRRGTELFLHIFQKVATAQGVQAIVWYTED